jgi:transcriptional regulator with XRE-family HTH domain
MEDLPINTDPIPNLKERIVAVLRSRNFTYQTLVDHLGTTEADLDRTLEQNTIEIRTLELISKELRIPLYSFFRDTDFDASQPDQPYYNVNIWAPETIQVQTENETLRQEIERLRLEISKRDLLIQGLEEQLKSKF